MLNLATLIIIVLAEWVLGIATLRKNTHNIANRFFALMCFSMSIWTITLYFFSQPWANALLWGRAVFVAGYLSGFFLLSFAIDFPSMHGIGRLYNFFSKFRFIHFVLVLILSIVSLSTSLILDRVEFYEWGTNFVPGPLYFTFIVNMVFSVLAAAVLLIMRYRKIGGLEKLQVKYLFLGISISGVIAIGTNILWPLFTDNNKLAQFGPYSMVILLGFTAYAIARYRLMDIRLVIKYAAINIVSVLLVITFDVLAMYLHEQYFAQIIDPYVLGPVILVISIIIYQLVKNLLQSFAERYIFNEVYSYQEALKRLSVESTQIINLEELVEIIVDTLMKSMGLNRSGILLAEKVVTKVNGKIKAKGKHELHKEKHVSEYHIAKVIGFKESNGISLVKDNFLTAYLQKHKQAVVFEEISLMIRDAHEDTEKEHLRRLQKNMQKIEAGVCLPLFSHKELIGLMVLGNKISKEAYTLEDIQILENLSVQASIAIANAQLYEDMKLARGQLENFNQVLHDKVNEQTQDLQELLDMKSEFLTIASHQLRTPTSIVRGYLSMAEDPEVSTDDKKKFVDMAYQGINRMEKIIHDILSATELEGGKLNLNVEPADITEIIQAVIKELNEMADKKDLKIVFKPNNEVEKWPPMHLDKLKIHEALVNLVANSIYYTEKGEIKISLKESLTKGKKYATIEVQDTGIGFTKEDATKLTEKFFRAPGAKNVHPNGSGLGLFITKNIVEESGGTFGYQSPGINKGSIFIVNLPIS